MTLSPNSLQMIEVLRSYFNIPIFIETGTYLGETTAWAAQKFQTVHTVEWSSELFEKARSTLASHPSVTCHHGNSADVLPTLLSGISTPAVFFLDGHWSGGITVGQTDECPVLRELDAILAWGKEAFIFIDDARLFLAPPPEPHNWRHWPSLDEIGDRISQNGKLPFYMVVFEDELILVPQRFRDPVAMLLQKMVSTG
jgi:hypothetical protein